MSQRATDLASIAAVPESALSGPARAALIALVEQGIHAYCFTSLAAEPDEDPWRVWLEPIAQRHGHNGRLHLDVWCASWETYYRQFATEAR